VASNGSRHIEQSPSGVNTFSAYLGGGRGGPGIGGIIGGGGGGTLLSSEYVITHVMTTRKEKIKPITLRATVDMLRGLYPNKLRIIPRTPAVTPPIDPEDFLP